MESKGVASRRGEQEVGVASGWNLWIGLQCIGVASGCCCRSCLCNFLQYISKRYSKKI